MPKKIEFVQIEAGEDATSVRDRLSFLRGQQVLLIWPEEGTALTRKLDLVLIQREAMRRAIRLALVTHDAEVIENAKDLNISTFETIGASERGRWKRGRSKVFTTRFQRPKDEPEPEELMDVASRVRVQGGRALSGVVRLMIVLLVLGALGGVGYLVIPSATVTVRLAEEPVIVTDWAVTASPNISTVDVENSRIPARTQIIEIEETSTRTTSGTLDLSDIPARGTVTFINRTTNAIEIPAGTVVSTSSGVPLRYQTLLDVTLLGGVEQQVDIAIEALPESTGSIGNIDAGLINNIESAWRENVNVINLLPITGGESTSLPAVSQDDRDRLLAAVNQQLQSRALNEFKPLTLTEVAIPETVRIVEERSDWTRFSANVGDPAESLTLTKRAHVEVVVVDRKWAEQIAFAQLGRQIPRGRVIKPESIQYSYGDVVNVDENNNVTFLVSGTGLVAGETDVRILQERLAGRTREDAVGYLNNTLDLAAEPEIMLMPDWFDRLPPLPVRITVRVLGATP
jgi:hypothetical protein